jgi:hypothetical protein
MIRRYLLPGLLFLLAAFSVEVAEAKPKDTFTRLGDSAYARKLFDSAIYYYQQATASARPDPVALYKLGNAHFRLHQTGEAVLAYERALKRRPGFAAAAENLEIIQRNIQPQSSQDEAFLIRWWRAITKPSMSNTWAILGILFFSFPLCVLTWSRFRRSWPSWLWPRAVVWGIGLSLFFALLASAGIPDVPDNPAVVMREDAAFRPIAKPGSVQGELKLPEGLVLTILGEDGSQVRVALPDGREGFIQAADIALVE